MVSGCDLSRITYQNTDFRMSLHLSDNLSNKYCIFTSFFVFQLPQAASGLIHTPTGLVGLHHGLPQAAGLIQTSMALSPSGHLVATPNHHVIHATNPLASNQLTALQAAANPSILAAFGSHSSDGAAAAAAAAHSVGAAPHIVLPTGQIVRLVKPM